MHTLFDKQSVVNGDSEHAPQTPRDGKTGHMQFIVSHDTVTSDTTEDMMPSYTAAFVERPREVSEVD